MPSKEIVVNAAENQTRIAIVEGGDLVELYIENPDNKRTIGNLYLGRVRKVMPSIQAAFVDIGQEQDAFLHFSDLSDNLDELVEFLALNKPRVSKIKVPEGRDENYRPKTMLQRGQPLLVQITKEPISNKGSRISTDLSLAGRFLVLVPLQNYVAVSRKITNQKERRRLKALASSLIPDGFGVIVRTVAEGRDAKSLDKDLKLLMERWSRVEKRLAENPSPPMLIHEDVDMASSIIRDQFSDDYERITVDDKGLYHSIRSYVRAVAPQMVDRVQLHDAKEPVFKATGIQRGAEKAFKDRVELPSGGYLFIERTEAMHVIDVNSGRSGRGMSQAENSLKVNLEAARVIVQQIRLRDLGGIIVIDFIDLRGDKDRKKVYDEVKKGFKDDRAVTKILPMSDFGLVEITRQRLRPSITSTFASASGDAVGAESEPSVSSSGSSREHQQQQQEEERSSDRDQSSDRKRGGRSSRRRGRGRSGDEDQQRELRRLRSEVKRLRKEAGRSEEGSDEAKKQAKELEELRATVERLEREAQEARSQAEQARRQAKQAKAQRTEQAQPTQRQNGRGPDEIVEAIEQWVADYKASGSRRAVTLCVHPFTAAFLNRPVPSYSTRWFMRHLVRVHIQADSHMSPLAYRFLDTQTGDVLAEEAPSTVA